MKKRLIAIASAVVVLGLVSAGYANFHREKMDSKAELSKDAAECQYKKTAESMADFSQKALESSPDNKTYKEYAESASKKLQEVVASCGRVENWERKYGESYRL